MPDTSTPAPRIDKAVARAQAVTACNAHYIAVRTLIPEIIKVLEQGQGVDPAVYDECKVNLRALVGAYNRLSLHLDAPTPEVDRGLRRRDRKVARQADADTRKSDHDPNRAADPVDNRSPDSDPDAP